MKINKKYTTAIGFSLVTAFLPAQALALGECVSDNGATRFTIESPNIVGRVEYVDDPDRYCITQKVPVNMIMYNIAANRITTHAPHNANCGITFGRATSTQTVDADRLSQVLEAGCSLVKKGRDDPKGPCGIPVVKQFGERHCYR